MKSPMIKTSLREIKNSFGRWLAILAIVALGVGFFCGLKVCRAAFLQTGDTYLQEHKLFDFELISTLGLEQEDADYVSSLDGIALAEGSFSADALIALSDGSGGDRAAKLLTLSENVNTPSLTAGSMPEKPDQCLADAEHFSKKDIGKRITFSSSNEQDTLDMLAGDSYEITGLANSPLYLNFERGSTSIGTGKVDCFIIIPKDGWDSDVFTEIYVKTEKSAPIFSEEYDDIIYETEDSMSDAAEFCSKRRYDSVVSEAEKEVSDAQAELDDAKKELADNEKKLNDAEAEIKDKEAELKDAQAQIADKEAELSDARAQIEDGERELASARKELDDNAEELDAAQKLIDDGLKDYQSGLEQYDMQKQQAYGQLEAAFGAGLMTPEQYAYQKSALDAQFAAALKELDGAKAELGKNQADVDSGRRKLAEGFKEADISEKELADARRELEDGRSQIEDAKKELEDGRNQLNDARRELEDGRAGLEDGRAEIEDAQAELSDARKKIADIEEPDSYSLTRATNIGYVCFDNDSGIVEGIAKVFPVFFFLVAALVCMTTMSRMIDEQRTQIGVLKALGYGRYRILSKYLFYSASSAVIGGVGGFFGGTYLFTWVIWKAYGMMYGFSDVIFVFDWVTGGLALLAAFVCSAGTTVYSCYHELFQVPAQLIRPKAPPAGKRILLEKIPFFWDRLKFLRKVSIRNIFRYKKRFFMMVLGICGCTALLVTGLGIKDSIENVVTKQYGDIYHVDYTVTFDDTMDEEAQARFVSENSNVISEALFLYTGSAEARTDDAVKSVNLVVCSPEDDISSFIDLHNDDGPISYPGEGEGVINASLARTLGIGVGDELSVYDSDQRPMTVKISGICDNYVYNYLYVTYDTFGEAYGVPDVNSAFVLGIEDDSGEVSDPHGDGSLLMSADNVSAVSITQDFKNRINSMMKSLDYIVALVVACAGALAFIVLYNLTNINITERIREIATIKVLGFYPAETSAYVFRENIVLTAISAVLGLPLGAALHAFVMSQVKIDLLSFDIHIEPLSYAIGVIGTFIFAMAVNVAMYYKIDKISMTESLKSIE